MKEGKRGNGGQDEDWKGNWKKVKVEKGKWKKEGVKKRGGSETRSGERNERWMDKKIGGKK